MRHLHASFTSMQDHVKTLDEAIAAVRDLPPEVQELIARDLLDRAREYSDAGLTDEQQAEVLRRLDNSPRYADEASMATFFERHGIY